MAQYRVSVTAQVQEGFDIVVEAANEADAEAQVQEIVATLDLPDPEEHAVVSCEEWSEMDGPYEITAIEAVEPAEEA
jgi:hypothetical protein